LSGTLLQGKGPLSELRVLNWLLHPYFKLFSLKLTFLTGGLIEFEREVAVPWGFIGDFSELVI
jgi:hypothetical protein